MSKDDSMNVIDQLAAEGRLEADLDKLLNDERLPEFIAEKFFTDKQWDALTEAIPMTQEIFDRCLYVCDHVNDSVWFQRIIEQFPNFEVKYSKDVCEKHKTVHDAYKKEYLAKFGDNGWLFQD